MTSASSQWTARTVGFFGAIAVLAGGALPLAFAPCDYGILAFFAPALLFWLWQQASPKYAALLGFFFGLGFFTVGTSWVFISINTYGNTPLVLSILITAIMISYLALFPALNGYLLQRFFQSTPITLKALGVFPALWVLLEVLREFLFSGFPWLSLGYSQINTPLGSIAPIFGVYGVSFLSLVVAGALSLLLTKSQSYRQRLILAVFTLSLFAIGKALEPIQWTTPSSHPLNVTLIQGNVAQPAKWQSQNLQEILDSYYSLTKKHWHSQLIVWPEAAIPTLPSNIPDFLNKLQVEAKKHRSSVLFGAPVYQEKSQQFYNALMLLGENQGVYYKRHLVPFGEYEPLKYMLRWLIEYFAIPMSDFSPGPAHQAAIRIGNIKLDPYICYEIAFPHLVLQSIDNRNIIVTVSDDSWFGRSIALDQHFQMAQMRALETGRPAILSTNTGLSGFISAKGKVEQIGPIDQKAVLQANVFPRYGKTPLMRWHYYPVTLFSGLLLIIALILRWRRINKV